MISVMIGMGGLIFSIVLFLSVMFSIGITLAFPFIAIDYFNRREYHAPVTVFLLIWMLDSLVLYMLTLKGIL